MNSYNNLDVIKKVYEPYINIIRSYDNLLKPIMMQQEVASTFANSGLQEIISKQNLFTSNLANPLIDYSKIASLYNQFSTVAQVHEEIYSAVQSINLGISNVVSEIQYIDWSSILGEIEEHDLEEVNQVDDKEIRGIVTGVLEENDLVNPNKSLEEKINILRDEMKTIKESQSPRNTIMLSIIANIIFALFITLISPFLEPIKEEYSTFVHEKGREVIKEIKQKVQNTIDIALIEQSYKIVSIETLSVRITNKRNSKKVGELYFGQLVQVVERKRNWTKVRFEGFDGNKIEGWGYSRYLESISK